jgi:hypothetical protein
MEKFLDYYAENAKTMKTKKPKELEGVYCEWNAHFTLRETGEVITVTSIGAYTDKQAFLAAHESTHLPIKIREEIRDNPYLPQYDCVIEFVGKWED